MTQVMGLGYLGEVRAGPDGNLYQWVEGYDGLGNPFGFWKTLTRAALHLARGGRRRRPYRRAMPAGPALNGWGLGADELTQVMGLGYLGEVRAGPDGNLYQWVEGYDGLGNPVGFWKRLKKLARRAIPWVQNVATFVPGLGPAVAAGLKVATPYLKQAGVLGIDGLGALYQAPDGSLYQVQGLDADDELRGFAADDELRSWDGLDADDDLRGLDGQDADDDLRGLGALYQAPDGSLYQVQGLDADDELRGFAADDELRGWDGLEADDDLRGFAADDEMRGWDGLDADDDLRGFAADEELRGLADIDGYVPDTGINGLEAYVPEQAPQTRWFTPPSQPPDTWRALW
jgi:hypothetical protein